MNRNIRFVITIMAILVIMTGSIFAGGNKEVAGAKISDGSVAGKTVVFIPKLTGNAFFESANNGAQSYAKKWGFTVDYQGSSNAAVADQVQVINNAVASGADAICISSVDASGLDEALKNVNVLSGGEKVRCVLSKMMLSGANFLIFDEPTNHLDMESITALNEGMKKFTGNIIFTSHDHELTQTVANRIIDIKENGEVIDREISYNEYLGVE